MSIALAHWIDRSKPQPLGNRPLGNDLIQPHEGPAGDEQNVRRVHTNVVLFRMFPSAFERHVADRPFHQLEERLLDALA